MSVRKRKKKRPKAALFNKFSIVIEKENETKKKLIKNNNCFVLHFKYYDIKLRK